MKINRENEILSVVLDERIDSSNAPEIEEQLTAVISQSNPNLIELNAKKLQFISSAGLRVLLKLAKQGIKLMITEVSSEVYEVLEVTGFTSLINAKKALRQVSVEGCKLIGRGGTAAVYRLDEDTIIKIYNDNVDLTTIEKEKIYTRKAFELGMPCAISYDVVKCDGKYGIVYEMIQLNTLSELMAADTEKIEEYAVSYAELGRLVHGLKADPDVYPRTVQLYHNEIDLLIPYISPNDVQTLHQFIDSVPERQTLIHGDFHLNNVMIQNNEFLLIDMADVSWGHPIYELACTYVSLVSICSRGSEFTKNMYGLEPDELMRVWNQFVKTYFHTDDDNQLDEIEAMLQPFAMLKNVLRLVSSGPVPQEMLPMLIGMVKAKLLPAIAVADIQKLDQYFKNKEEETKK